MRGEALCGQLVIFHKFFCEISIFHNDYECWCSFEDNISETEGIKNDVRLRQTELLLGLVKWSRL